MFKCLCPYNQWSCERNLKKKCLKALDRCLRWYTSIFQWDIRKTCPNQCPKLAITYICLLRYILMQVTNFCHDWWFPLFFVVVLFTYFAIFSLSYSSIKSLFVSVFLTAEVLNVICWYLLWYVALACFFFAFNCLELTNICLFLRE